MIYSRKKDNLKDLEELADLQSKVKQVRLVEKLGKQGFYCDTKEFFEPITKVVTDTSQKLLEERKSTTKAIEELDESNVHVKTLQLINQSGEIHSKLIRPIAKLLVPTIKSHFRLYDDPDSDNWNDYVMNGEKDTKYNHKLVFKKSGKVFTLRGDFLKLITEYKFNTTDSRDTKLIIDFMHEISFDIHARGKSLRDRHLIKNF